MLAKTWIRIGSRGCRALPIGSIRWSPVIIHILRNAITATAMGRKQNI